LSARKVAIELDGAHHDGGADAERDRFANFHVRHNLPGVVKAIRELVLSRAALSREPKTSRENEEN
jgi:very-short-patch-repair endonuclease